jgi:hypothetical protein
MSEYGWEKEIRGTYMSIATTAMSSGYTRSAKFTPRMYHMTPFVVFCPKDISISVAKQEKKKDKTQDAPSHYPSSKIPHTVHKPS